MAYEVRVPELGEEAGTEVTITYWYFTVGDYVDVDDDLVALSTDKAAFDLPAPISGTITEILAEEGDTVSVHEVIAIIEQD